MAYENKMNNFSGKLQQEVEVKASNQYHNERQKMNNESSQNFYP